MNTPPCTSLAIRPNSVNIRSNYDHKNNRTVKHVVPKHTIHCEIIVNDKALQFSAINIKSSTHLTAQFLLLGNQTLDAIVHLLDSLKFSQTKTRLVGHIIDATLRLTVLTVDAADL